MFFVRQRRAFAGGADRHEAFCPLRDLPIDQFPKRFLVDGTVLEWGDQRGEGASKARLGGHVGESLNERSRWRSRVSGFSAANRINIALRLGLKALSHVGKKGAIGSHPRRVTMRSLES